MNEENGRSTTTPPLDPFSRKFEYRLLFGSAVVCMLVGVVVAAVLGASPLAVSVVKYVAPVCAVVALTAGSIWVLLQHLQSLQRRESSLGLDRQLAGGNRQHRGYRIGGGCRGYVGGLRLRVFGWTSADEQAASCPPVDRSGCGSHDPGRLGGPTGDSENGGVGRGSWSGHRPLVSGDVCRPGVLCAA